MTDGERAICREDARELMREVMAEHIASCPHGKNILKARYLIIGLFGSNIAGGGVVAAIIHFATGS